MPLGKVSRRGQVTIPAKLREKCGLEDGMFVEFFVRKDGILIRPRPDVPKDVPRDEWWFWTETWQKKEREADQAIAEGRVVGPFDNVEDLIRALRTGKRMMD